MILDEELPQYTRIHLIEETPLQQVIYNEPIKTRSDKGKQRLKYSSKLDPKYKSYLMRANKKQISMELSEDEFKSIISGNCYYCGSSYKIGIDRVNSLDGYLIDNVVPCCTKCNMMKYINTQEEFISHIRRILKHHDNR